MRKTNLKENEKQDEEEVVEKEALREACDEPIKLDIEIRKEKVKKPKTVAVERSIEILVYTCDS